MPITPVLPLSHAFRRLSAAVQATFVASALIGCATTGGGDLPLGDWAGRGTFIYEEWAPGGPAGQGDVPATPTNGPTISRDYDTTLSLRSEKLGALDIVRMEIRSTRGELPNLETETHLVAALVPEKRVSDSARLYRAVALQLNPKPDEALAAQDDAPPFAATCTTHGDTTTFRIWYSENFFDAFRFQGGTVEKSGLLFDEKRGTVQWSEMLKRK